MNYVNIVMNGFGCYMIQDDDVEMTDGFVIEIKIFINGNLEGTYMNGNNYICKLEEMGRCFIFRVFILKYVCICML